MGTECEKREPSLISHTIVILSIYCNVSCHAYFYDLLALSVQPTGGDSWTKPVTAFAATEPNSNEVVCVIKENLSGVLEYPCVDSREYDAFQPCLQIKIVYTLN